MFDPGTMSPKLYTMGASCENPSLTDAALSTSTAPDQNTMSGQESNLTPKKQENLTGYVFWSKKKKKS